MQKVSAKPYHVLGMMSGTSLDGLDIAYCEFHKTDNKWIYKILESDTFEYSESLKNALVNAKNLNPAELMELHDQYGIFVGQKAKEFIEENALNPELIASHGHTVFHEPARGITFQLGNGKLIAETSGLPVIWDFRTQDVAKGGQGAPLVPVGDILLFGDYEFCLNLGGFSNVSYDHKGKRIAFDICPVNIVLNYLAEEKGITYDKNGELARKGTMNAHLLDQLNALEYFQKPFPKSLGREWVEEFVLPLIAGFQISVEDKLNTFCTHIAHQLAQSINHYAPGNVLCTGGGTMNKYLMKMIRERVTHNLIIPDSKTIQYKEALVFAFLAVLRLENSINCLASVTGATSDSSSGTISLPGV